MNNATSFMIQTAKDYGIEVCDVERIFNASDADTFYDNLELFIKGRAKNEN